MTKYILTDETYSKNDKTLYRIKAVKSFSNIKKNAWVYSDMVIKMGAIWF